MQKSSLYLTERQKAGPGPPGGPDRPIGSGAHPGRARRRPRRPGRRHPAGRARRPASSRPAGRRRCRAGRGRPAHRPGRRGVAPGPPGGGADHRGRRRRPGRSGGARGAAGRRGRTDRLRHEPGPQRPGALRRPGRRPGGPLPGGRRGGGVDHAGRPAHLLDLLGGGGPGPPAATRPRWSPRSPASWPSRPWPPGPGRSWPTNGPGSRSAPPSTATTSARTCGTRPRRSSSTRAAAACPRWRPRRPPAGAVEAAVAGELIGMPGERITSLEKLAAQWAGVLPGDGDHAGHRIRPPAGEAAGARSGGTR